MNLTISRMFKMCKTILNLKLSHYTVNKVKVELNKI